MNPAPGVIFDMDGVLVDSYRAHFQSWRDTAATYGLSMTEPQFEATFGRTSREIIEALWPGRFKADEIVEFDAKKETEYRRLLRTSFPEMPGAGELLSALRAAGFRLAIGSSGPPENVRAVLECISNGKLFDATVDGSEVKKGKPDPQVFLVAAQKLGLEPSRCAVVEDALVGIEAAKRAGMVAIALTGTASRDQLAARADLVVDSLRELSPRIIAQLIG